MSLSVLGASRAHGEPQLRVAGSDADGIKLTRAEPEVRHTFRVVAMNAEKVAVVELSVAPLQDEAGREVREATWRWVGAREAEISLESPRTFEVLATLPRPGVYTTDVDLVYAGKRTTTHFTVTRAAPAAPGVAVVGSQGARVVKGFGLGHVEIDVTLREAEGAERTLEAPVLSFLSLKGAGSDRFQKREGALTTTGAPLVLGPNQEKSTTVRLGGFDEAGQYEGSARFDVPGRRPLDVPFTVTVKESGWIAVLFIAAGVLGSYGIRRYFGTVRKRLLARRDILRVTRDLEARCAADADERERRVTGALRRRLDELREDLDLDVDTDVGAALEVTVRKLAVLDAWRDLRARAAKLGPEAARPFLYEIESVASVLVRASATLKQVDHAAGTLDALDVRASERAALSEAIRALEKEGAVERASAGRTTPERAEAEAQLERLTREAWLLLAKDSIEEARPLVEEAQLVHVRLLVVSLRDRLDGSMPRGFEEGAWGELRASLAPRLEEAARASGADAASLAYGAAAQRYLTAVATALRREADTLATALVTSEIPEQRPLAARLERVRAQLDEAATKVAGPSWREAATIEAAADAELAAVEGVIFPRMGRAFTAEGAEDVWAPGVVPELDLRAGDAGEPSRPPTPEALTARLRSYDGAVTAFILLIAVGTGLKVLWAGNETWGGFESWLVALLWGLGLHQVGSAPFEGLMGLRDKVAKVD